MQAFENEYYDLLLDVKKTFNQYIESCSINGDITDMINQCNCMLRGYNENKTDWMKMQRAAYIMRFINYLILKYPSYICDSSQTGDLWDTIMSKIFDIYEKENLDPILLNYLSLKFPAAHQAYEEW